MIEPIATSFIVQNSTIPLCCAIPGGKLSPGTSIEIVGNITHNYANRFKIDFISDNCEHGSGELSLSSQSANPKSNECDNYERNVLVMNSFLRQRWKREKRKCNKFPLVHRKQLKMKILVEMESFLVLIDGQPVCSYPHRVPIHQIGSIHLGGDLSLQTITFRNELVSNCAFPPQDSHVSNLVNPNLKFIRSPQLPYSDKDSRFSKPFNLYLTGYIPHSSDIYFTINLLTSGEMIPFHLNIHPTIFRLIRNSFQDGQWQSEECLIWNNKMVTQFPLPPGTHFDMMIGNKRDRVIGVINGLRAFEFMHRIDPSNITKVEMIGNVELSSIRYEFFDNVN